MSAPSKSDDVETIVHGVNTPQGGTAIISCASCTTNCITPVMEILGRRIGVKKAIMTTVHAYTSSQAIVDSPHNRVRRGRAGAANIVPTSTGAAAATAKALPEYRGRFDGVAVRAPVAVGSLADIVAVAARPTTVDEVNRVFTEEAESQRYRGVLGVTTDPLVSSDIIKDSRASVVDLGMTQVVDGDLIKVMSWYDNEWGYSNQLVREALRIAKADGWSCEREGPPPPAAVGHGRRSCPRDEAGGNDHIETCVRRGLANRWHPLPGGTAVAPRGLQGDAPGRRVVEGGRDPALSCGSGSVTILTSGTSFGGATSVSLTHSRRPGSRSCRLHGVAESRSFTAHTTRNTTMRSPCSSSCERKPRPARSKRRAAAHRPRRSMR